MGAYFDISAKIWKLCCSDDLSLDEPTIAINNSDLFFHNRLFKILFLEMWNKEILHY